MFSFGIIAENFEVFNYNTKLSNLFKEEWAVLKISKTEMPSSSKQLTKLWSISNKFAFKEEKREVVHICSKFKVCDPPALTSLHIGDCHVSVAPEARSLGVIFDQHLT